LRSGQAGPTVSITNPLANSTVSSSTLPVSIQAASPQGVASVQYSLDGTVLATATSQPFDANLDVSGFGDGFDTLRAVATDGSGVTGSAEITINLLTNKTVPTAYFLSPKAHASVSQSSFPLEVDGFAFDPDGVASVTLSIKSPGGSLT